MSVSEVLHKYPHKIRMPNGKGLSSFSCASRLPSGRKNPSTDTPLLTVDCTWSVVQISLHTSTRERPSKTVSSKKLLGRPTCPMPRKQQKNGFSIYANALSKGSQSRDVRSRPLQQGFSTITSRRFCPSERATNSRFVTIATGGMSFESS